MQPRQRRNSNLERDLTQALTSKPNRPSIQRPKSANDATTLSQFDDIPASPTKGILLTPGTAAGRGKTVTFGEHLTNASTKRPAEVAKKVANDVNENKRAKRNGTKPDFVPNDSRSDVIITRHKVQQDRGKHINDQCDCEDGGLDKLEEPTCAAGRHWKQQYERYCENTTQEIRKLATKQRAAKGYAREKDEQCTALSDELRLERKKVERLELLANGLEEQVKQLTLQLRKQTASSPRAVSSNVNEVNDQHSESTEHRTRSKPMPSISHAVDLDPQPCQDVVEPVLTGSRRLDNSRSSVTRMARISPKQVLATKSSRESALKDQLVTKVHEDTLVMRAETVEQVSNDAALSVLSVNAISGRQNGREPSEAEVRRAEEDKRRPRPQRQTRHDSFEPDLSISGAAPDAKNSMSADRRTTSIEQAHQTITAPARLDEAAELSQTHAEAHASKRIVSRGGDVIPPDRIAAARARLALRRMQRTDSN